MKIQRSKFKKKLAEPSSHHCSLEADSSCGAVALSVLGASQADRVVRGREMPVCVSDERDASEKAVELPLPLHSVPSNVRQTASFMK